MWWSGVPKGCQTKKPPNYRNKFSGFMVEAKGFEPYDPLNNIKSLGPL